MRRRNLLLAVAASLAPAARASTGWRLTLPAGTTMHIFKGGRGFIDGPAFSIDSSARSSTITGCVIFGRSGLIAAAGV